MLEPLMPIVHGKKGPPLISEWQRRPWGDLNQSRIKNNKCNLGLRLDQYLAVDPDDDAAVQICDELERTGVLPPTVAWKTWRDRTVRLYQLPPKKYLHSPIKPTGSPMLELRMGAGQYVLVPPSVINDPETKKHGFYRFVSHQTPSDMEPAELPLESLERLIEIAKSGGGIVRPANTDLIIQKKTIQPTTLTFEQGGRDNSLYSVALALRKGGMGRGDIEKTLLQLAGACEPPMSERDVLRKIDSAFKDTPGERNFKAEIEMWIETIEGVFSSQDIDRDLGINSKQEKASRRLVLKRLRDEGIIKRISEKSNLYSKTDLVLPKLDYKNANAQDIYKIIWPFRLHKYVDIYPQNIVVVGGASNAGKTAFLLNTVAMNLKNHKIKYFSSEMGAVELRKRLDNFELPLSFWEDVDFYDRSFDFASVISPIDLNIIDYLEISDNFYQVGAEIKAIYDKLTTGIAVIALQKKKGAEFARGGEFTMEKSRLYISIDPNVLKIVKGKNWAQEGVNPNGMEFRFKLWKGYKFIDQ